MNTKTRILTLIVIIFLLPLTSAATTYINTADGSNQSIGGVPLFIDNTNNRVGVGTVSPSGTLEVAGSMRLSNGGNAATLNVDGSGNLNFDTVTDDFIFGDGGGSHNIRISSGSCAEQALEFSNRAAIVVDTGSCAPAMLFVKDGSSNNRLAINLSTGRVGIGSSAPQEMLTIQSPGSDPGARIELYSPATATAGYAGIITKNKDSNFFIGQRLGRDDFSIYDNNVSTERFTIDQSGNVGINTNSPSQQLSVDGGLNVTASDGTGITVAGDGNVVIRIG